MQGGLGYIMALVDGRLDMTGAGEEMDQFAVKLAIIGHL